MKKVQQDRKKDGHGEEEMSSGVLRECSKVTHNYFPVLVGFKNR